MSGSALSERTCVVAGAGSAMGRAIAVAFASAAVASNGVRVRNVYAPARLQRPEDIASVVLGALSP